VQYLTKEDAAKALGVSLPTINKYIRMLNIKVFDDAIDSRVRLVAESDMARLREVMSNKALRKEQITKE